MLKPTLTPRAGEMVPRMLEPTLTPQAGEMVPGPSGATLLPAEAKVHLKSRQVG